MTILRIASPYYTRQSRVKTPGHQLDQGTVHQTLGYGHRYYRDEDFHELLAVLITCECGWRRSYDAHGGVVSTLVFDGAPEKILVDEENRAHLR